MSDSKTYLNVPYAQKDAAKALGARWDPANKKWYVSGKDDINLFSAWLSVATDSERVLTKSSQSNVNSLPIKLNASANDIGQGVITYPADKAFFSYSGESPPWE